MSFIKVQTRDPDTGVLTDEILNTDEIAHVAKCDDKARSKCIVYLRSLKPLEVTQAFSWFEAALKSRRDT